MMRPLVLTVVFSGLLLAADEAPRSDLDKYQGTWVLVSEEYEGKPVPVEELLELSILVQGNQVPSPHKAQTARRSSPWIRAGRPKPTTCCGTTAPYPLKAFTPGMVKPSRFARRKTKGIARQRSIRRPGARIGFGSGSPKNNNDPQPGENRDGIPAQSHSSDSR
ncbi:hypothetical protein V5E97_23620 [Singulisphaera sp. Ch08]|uniref:Lipocalin-like domain-containing protein n=1 Tax=Singulisphaera sp. Ch08 TaxID=3120278 RepID=A0AAU7C8M9_9BACT